MKPLAAITALCLGLALLLGGTAPLGRALLAAGLPGAAVPFLSDPGWRGVAYYRAGRFDDAATAFTRARAFHNLGNAEVQRGMYAAALEAYDIAIVGGDADARANFDAVAAHYAGLAIAAETLALYHKREEGDEADSFVAHGDARAAGQGDEVTNTNTMLGLVELDSRGEQRGVRRVFDDNFMVADHRWLAQLDDVPGAFLSARIAHEHKRRRKAGLSPPEPEDPH